MGVKIITSILTFLAIFHGSCAQILLCMYRIVSTYGYTCDIFILNPSGTYNFSKISGTHLAGKTNEDVQRILRTTDSDTLSIPSIICEKFQNATRLELQGIRISRIDENSFWGCKGLKYLDLSFNLLKTLPRNAFSIHPSSYNNNIYELPWDKYGSHLPSLETLYLHYNRIEEIQPETFNPLVSSKTLLLNSNKIKRVFPELFDTLKNLTVLYLNHNQIEEIPPKTFSSLINLVELILSDNNISKIFSDSFEMLEKLTTLYLFNNKIEELPRSSFSSLKQLPTIYLSNNKLKVIHSFGILPKLTQAFLEGNQIDAFDQNFIDDTGLTTLDMSNNLCANFTITDTSASRIQMRMKLLKCFENYANLQPETTTTITTESSTTDVTLPPGCIGGSLDERVCRLEDLNEDFHGDLKNQRLLIVDIQLYIEELEKKIDELANRPCAC